MILEFWKYQGTGNDFILVDNRDRRCDGLDEERIAFICNRHFGVGSDGLLLVQSSDEADFEMVFFNPDGSRSLCGNGSRCAVIFAERLGMAKESGTFVTTDGVHHYRICEGSEVSVSMHSTHMPTCREGHAWLHTGSPHLVVETEDVDAVDVIHVGSALRYAKEFQPTGGTNVNFVAPLGDNSFGVRTYERGVENETLSCGTGVTAVALAMAAAGKAKSPVEIHTHGGILNVTFVKSNDGFADIWLTGPVKFVFKGTIDA